MAINATTDDGGEEQYPLEGAAEHLHPAAPEHEQAMESLSPEPEQDVGQIKVGHEEVMAQLSPPLATPAPTPTQEIQQLASSVNLAAFPDKPQRGRTYYPPKERTAANREERRTAVQESRRPEESPTLEGFMAAGGELPDPSTDDLGHESQSLGEAFFRLGSAHSSAITDLIRRVDQLTEAVERMRM